MSSQEAEKTPILLAGLLEKMEHIVKQTVYRAHEVFHYLELENLDVTISQTNPTQILWKAQDGAQYLISVMPYKPKEEEDATCHEE